jgi:hypothetical protein
MMRRDTARLKTKAGNKDRGRDDCDQRRSNSEGGADPDFLCALTRLHLYSLQTASPIDMDGYVRDSAGIDGQREQKTPA